MGVMYGLGNHTEHQTIDNYNRKIGKMIPSENPGEGKGMIVVENESICRRMKNIELF